MRVLRISHSAVVTAWRERERALRRLGLDVSLVTATVWDEGGRPVPFEPHGDAFAQGARTWGRHPNVFVFDPRPLWRLLGQDWDVLDIHEEPCSLAVAEVLLLSRLRRRRPPLVLYSAQNIQKRFPVPFRWIERWSLRRAAAVSVCNRAAGEILLRKGLEGRAVEIPLGVDVQRFAPADRAPPVSSSLRIGYVGRLAEHKGVHVLLRSLVAHPEWTLDVVGAGPADASLRALASELGLSERVRFLGSDDDDSLPGRYRTLDVVAIPSLPTSSWEEQFGRVAVEAMASGVPVVASRSGALPEVIGDAGTLVEPDDPDALRQALAELSGDGALWSARRAAGLDRSRRFTWEAVADRYAALYYFAVAP